MTSNEMICTKFITAELAEVLISVSHPVALTRG